jgi:hypothetical protein
MAAERLLRLLWLLRFRGNFGFFRLFTLNWFTRFLLRRRWFFLLVPTRW